MAAALQIHPHSHRITSLAVAGLALVAAGAFSLGLEHQMRRADDPVFPGPTAGLQAYALDTIPEATPAREIEVATAAPRATRPAAPSDLPPALEAPAAADVPPAVDAAATEPDPSPGPTPGPSPMPSTVESPADPGSARPPT